MMRTQRLVVAVITAAGFLGAAQGVNAASAAPELPDASSHGLPITPPPSLDGKGPDPDQTYPAVVDVTPSEGKRAIAEQHAVEAASYAKVKGITVEEAARRLEWQSRAGKLAERGEYDNVRAAFGGVWIDTDTGRVKVGIAEGHEKDADLLRAAIRDVGLDAAADVERVRYSQQELRAVIEWLDAELAPTRKDTKAVMYGLATDKNVVEVQVPRSGEGYTAAQREPVNEAGQRFGDAIQIEFYEGKPAKHQCSQAPYPQSDKPYPFCHPPLRGGITINPNTFDNQPGCTGAFVTREPASGWTFYMTAGHCLKELKDFVPPHNEVTTKFAWNGVYHQVGPVLGWHDSYWGDAGIATVWNTGGWGPQPFIFYTASGELTRMEDYKVKYVGTAVVGTWVCAARAASGASDCGYVTQKYFTDDTGTAGLDKASYCGRTGDSGSPLSSWTYAFGVHRGGLPPFINPCQSWYTTMPTALWLTNTQLVVWPY